MPDFNHLRDLADLLDLHLGVETRKNILQGNEKLTLGTNVSDWMNGVQNRLNGLGSSDFASSLVKSMIVIPGSKDLPPIDKR